MDKQFDNEDIYAEPDINKTYDCSDVTASKGFTKLMKWVLMTKKHPKLLKEIEILLKKYKLISDEVLNIKNISKEIKDFLIKNIKKDLMINKQNYVGWTALHLASRNSNTDSTESTVKLLLEYGADPNIQNNDGWTSLLTASRYSNTDSTESTVKLLLEYGADPNIVNDDNKIPEDYLNLKQYKNIFEVFHINQALKKEYKRLYSNIIVKNIKVIRNHKQYKPPNSIGYLCLDFIKKFEENKNINVKDFKLLVQLFDTNEKNKIYEKAMTFI